MSQTDSKQANTKVRLIILPTLTIFVEKRRNWWRVLAALLFSIIWQGITRMMGWTYEDNILHVLMNAVLIWSVLSIFHIIAYYAMFFFPPIPRWWFPIAWSILDIIIQFSSVLVSGWIFQWTMQLTDTLTPHKWGWYIIMVLPHVIAGTELRKQLARRK